MKASKASAWQYDVLERKLRAGFVFALLCLVAIAVASLVALARFREAAKQVAHSREVTGRVESILAAVIDAQNGHRGFALTGEADYLEPLTHAAQHLPGKMQELRLLLANDPEQQRRLGALETLVGAQLAYGASLIEVRRERGLDAARAVISTGEGEERRDQIHVMAGEMKRAEESRFVERERRAARSGRVAKATILLGSLVASSFVAFALWAMRRSFAGQRQAQEGLARSEESLAVTLHSIGDAVLATDTAGKITRMNRVAEHLTGVKFGEAEGRPIEEIFRIINEQTRAPASIPVGEVLATGEIHGLANHTVLISQDGTERAIADSAAPIRDRSGDVIGVVLVFRDVSEARESELKLAAAHRELEREKARLSFIFETVPVGISFTLAQADGRRSRLVNEEHLRICGLACERFNEPEDFLRSTHPDDLPAQARLIGELESGRIDRYTLDKRYVRPTGETVWVMLTFQRRRHPDGSCEDLSILTDITERKLAAQMTERQNAHLRAVFAALPGLYLVLKPDLTIVTASEAYVQATMTRLDAMVGRGLFEVFPDNPSDPAASGTANLRASLERVRNNKASDAMAIQKYDIRRPDGSFEERFWSPINSPVIGLDGAVEYIIHRVEDVTEFVRQKQGRRGEAPEDMKARLERMEAEVFQSSEKLRMANQQLRAANAELEAFSYSVSHDLRAPLRHVQGYVGMLVRENAANLSEKGRRYLKTIDEAAREMGQLIDDLLTFARMGRIEMRTATVDLNRLIVEVRQELELATRGRQIDWKIPVLPMVQGDRSMLKQVIANLLGNAVKYTRTRAVAEIELGSSLEENGRVVIFVRDNGVGFDMKYADKLFGVFQRLHHADQFEGTGVGLANVRRIILRHGGRTWAEAKPDAGATFYFSVLPADPEKSRSPHPRPSP